MRMQHQDASNREFEMYMLSKSEIDMIERLNQISLNDFIELSCGSYNCLLFDGEAATEEELKEIEEKAKKDLAAANRKALTAPDPDPKTIFNYVLPEPYEPEKYKDGTHRETEGEKKFLCNCYQ